MGGPYEAVWTAPTDAETESAPQILYNVPSKWQVEKMQPHMASSTDNSILKETFASYERPPRQHSLNLIDPGDVLSWAEEKSLTFFFIFRVEVFSPQQNRPGEPGH